MHPRTSFENRNSLNKLISQRTCSYLDPTWTHPSDRPNQIRLNASQVLRDRSMRLTRRTAKPSVFGGATPTLHPQPAKILATMPTDEALENAWYQLRQTTSHGIIPAGATQSASTNSTTPLLQHLGLPSNTNVL